MKPKVAILIPTLRGLCPKVQDALDAMIQHTMAAGVECEVKLEVGSLVHVARNELVKWSLRRGTAFTHGLFVDDDMVPEPDSLLKLLAHNHGVASGLYVTREAQPHPVAWKLDPLGHGDHLREWVKGEAIEVEWVGAGFLLVRFDVLKRMAERYCECRSERELFGEEFPLLREFQQGRVQRFMRDNEIEWFRFLPTPGGSTFGEDSSFCIEARAAGFPTLLDTSVEVGHLGEKVYLPRDMEQLATVERDSPLASVALTREGEDGLWHRIDIMTAELEVLEFLASLVNLLKPKLVVETGSYEGWSALYMAKALQVNGRGQLITIELNEDLFRKTSDRLKGTNCTIAVYGSSLDYLPGQPIDLLFCDSDIDIRLQEIDHFMPYLHANSVIVMHDTDCAPQLEKGLAEHPRLKCCHLPTPRGLTVMMLK